MFPMMQMPIMTPAQMAAVTGVIPVQQHNLILAQVMAQQQAQLSAARQQRQQASANITTTTNTEIDALKEQHEKELQTWDKKQEKLKEKVKSQAKEIKDLKKQLQKALRRGFAFPSSESQNDASASTPTNRTSTQETEMEANTEEGEQDTSDHTLMTDDSNIHENGIILNLDKTPSQHDMQWMESFQKLVQFRQEFGHTLVNRRDGEYKKLNRWVRTQRSQFNRFQKGKNTHMTPRRIQLLKGIGFCWDPNATRIPSWQQRIENLKEYREEHGHCNVPQLYNSNTKSRKTNTYHPPGLGEWVLLQRKSYMQGKMPAERIQELEALGFNWRLKNKTGTLEERMRYYAQQKEQQHGRRQERTTQGDSPERATDHDVEW